MTARSRNFAVGVVALLVLPLAATARASFNGAEQGKTAAQVLADATKAMMDAKDFHVFGHISNPWTSLNLSVSPGGGGGSVQLPGATMEIVVAAHKVYIKADEKSWLKLTGSKPVAKLVANRWIEAPETNPSFSSLAAFTESRPFIGQLVSGDSGLAKLPGTATWSGHQAIVLTDNAGGKLYVAARGTPYILHLQAQGSSSGFMTFSDFGDAPMPTVPTNAMSLPSSS